MSIETHLRNLAKHVQDLLCCDSVSVLLGCTEPTLSHPLLKNLPATGSALLDSATVGAAMPSLQHERIAALCDIACQTGGLWEINRVQLRDGSIGGIVVMPLVLSSKVLGLLLCCYKGSGACQVGTFHLLQQAQPALTHSIEALLLDEQNRSSSVQEIIEAGAQRELISMVSHELRVPLTVIKGYTVLLQTYAKDDVPGEIPTRAMPAEQRRQYLDAILEQVSHLEVLVNDLLDASRMQTGHLALHPEQLDLVALCLGVIKHIRERVDLQHPGCYTFRLHVEDELPLVWADPARVRQVLTNLVENAVKYSPNGGPIETTLFTRQIVEHEMASREEQRVSLSPVPGTYACVAVRDQGIGMPQQQQLDLFKPFVRLEHPQTRSVPGNGLGLYISRKLVEAMDGQMTLSSHEGRGTCVTFNLPAASVDFVVLTDEEGLALHKKDTSLIRDH